MIQRLSKTGIKGLVLFNRFFSPDFDIDKMTVKPSFVFSSPAELAISLRWIAIMANKVDCDLAASTGVHDGPADIFSGTADTSRPRSRASRDRKLTSSPWSTSRSSAVDASVFNSARLK
jgi:hypothetical protein